eukprot:TRINITY_DN2333_c0_g1_i1.p1 TRINITY_DN2333_c0_g1~~TRINITY_DN2333_c0_g1_i1.p1  ORF type:complete len:294 (+),score=31.60 TRINITY_DN2333_c0_g1_i1:79-882(+)
MATAALSSSPLSRHSYRRQCTCREILYRDLLTTRLRPTTSHAFLQGNHRRTRCETKRESSKSGEASAEGAKSNEEKGKGNLEIPVEQKGNQVKLPLVINGGRGEDGRLNSSWSFQVRRGEPRDLAEIRRILLSEVLNPFNLVAERLWVVVGGQEGELVAFCQFETIQDEPFICELRSMVVKSEYRNQGIGQAMLQEILDTVELRRPIYTITAGDKNCAFYKKIGFQEVEGDDIPTQLRMERLAAIIGGTIIGLGGGYCLRLDVKVTS